MQCSEPGAIRDEELLAYLADEYVRPAVVQHLARCQSCTTRLASYRRVEHKLLNKLYRWDCPSEQVLGEHQLGLLNNEQAATVKRHVETCALCTAEVATLTEFLANDPMLVERVPASSSNAVSPISSRNSHSSVREVKQVLDQLRDQAEASVRRIVATLLPPQPRPAYGVRGADATMPGMVWPRRYTAEGVNISIQVERGPGRQNELQLIGLVSRKGSTLESLQGVPVRLLSSANKVYTQQIDDLGNFVFAPVVPEIYTLELQFPEGVVIIDQVPITSQE
jgi:anti-sigma factor RsiW